MKQSSKTLRKMLAVALAVATIGSAGIMTEAGSFVGTNITVNAANKYELHTYNNITYALYEDGTAEAVSYSGSNKDFSSTYFSVPSVVYAKNLGKDYILDRSQFTVTKMQADGFSGIKARIFSLPNKLQVLFGGFRNTQIGCFGIATDNAYFSISPSAGGILLNRSGTEIVAYPTKPSLYYSSDFISIPSTVTRIGDFAFTGYKATSITIPSTVTYVGNAAFEYSSLQSITFNGNPSFYRASGESVCSFDNATNLTSINIKGTSGSYSTDTYGMLYNKDKTKFIYCPLGRTSAFNVADTCTEIVDWAFHNSSAKPVIYDNVTKISTIAFDGVKSGFKLYCLKDTSIETYAKNNNINYGYHFEYSTNSDGTLTVTKYSGPYNGPSLPEKV
ncbi:MAG: leucine-rich repeat domain-containing protein, partial [Clostridia bacterium]|nr:leucine-rich repeat domain-containing protein [Clostridia bacterium]